MNKKNFILLINNMDELSEFVYIYNYVDQFVMKKGKKSFSLNKESLDIEETQNVYEGKSEKIYNIAGIVDTDDNSYLLCASKVEIIGSLFDSYVYKINEVTICFI